MTPAARHRYVAVLGSCCTVDPIRVRRNEDAYGAKIRLLWYQGRTSFVSMTTKRLEPSEFRLTQERDKAAAGDWGVAMALDEVAKRHRVRLAEVITMADALVVDTVSAFVFPYLTDPDSGRCFLRSREWRRYVSPLLDMDEKMLWQFPIQRSLRGMQEVLAALYERQPSLRVIFHFPRPCFNDGVHFADAHIARNIAYYDRYNERLYRAATRIFPRVSAVSCGCERADPHHYNGPHPHHYDENYMNVFRKELERLVE